MTATLAQLADRAANERGGVDLLRFTFRDPIAEHSFARNSDGTVTLAGIDLCKVGTFYGMMGAVSLVDADLEAMVQRFANLRDSGTFLPPFRLDHSFSVLSVIGWFESLETYSRVDTDGLEKMFLRGDVRLTGSVDYEPAQIVDAIKRGALRNRSSELGWYETNNGVEFPLVFYGCAFVDIPAVEGLAPIELRAAALSRPSPHSVANLEESPTMLTAAQRARLAELRGISEDQLTAEQRGELVALEAAEQAGDEGTEAEGDAGEQADEGEAEGESGVAGGTTTSDPNTPAQPDAGEDDGGNANAAGDGTDDTEAAADQGQAGGQTTPPGTTTAPTGAPAAEVTELARLRQQVATMRQAAAEERIATFRSNGAIVQGNEDAAVALLSHDDDNVRRMAGTLLESLAGRVNLGRRTGQQESTGGSNAGGGAAMFREGMPSDEAGALWASLSTEEREKRQPEWDAYLARRRETGDRS